MPDKEGSNKNVGIQKLSEWLNSPEGQLTLERAFRKTDEIINRFVEAKRIDPQKFHEPVTI